jgi:hypothetical protein
VEVSRAMPCCVGVYMSVCEEEIMVNLVEEHTTLYDGTDSLVIQKRTKLVECMKTSAKDKLIYVVYTMHYGSYNVKPTNAHLLQFSFTKYLLHEEIIKNTNLMQLIRFFIVDVTTLHVSGVCAHH